MTQGEFTSGIGFGGGLQLPVVCNLVILFFCLLDPALCMLRFHSQSFTQSRTRNQSGIVCFDEYWTTLCL